MEEVVFLFDNQLIAALEKLIKDAKSKLVLISPFIDLDPRIKDALHEKISNYHLELNVLFGKNDSNYLKSIKKESLDFLMQFPNIEIRYNNRLHAKFYQSDSEYIMASLNLYNYSLANNIEVGVHCEFGAKGIIGKAILEGYETVSTGVDKVKQDVFGSKKYISPIEKFKLIFDNSELKYKTKPKLDEKGGIQGLVGLKKLVGFEIVVDEFKCSSNPHKSVHVPNSSLTPVQTSPSIQPQSPKMERHEKCLSASQLSKLYGIPQIELQNLMQIKGLIVGNKITEKGITSGLIMKSYMGNEYISYPDNLDELKELKKG